MITKNLIKSLEEIGFTYVEGATAEKGHAYAIYGGYLVSVYESAGNKVAYFNFKFPDSEENDIKKYNMSETFSNELNEYSVSDYTLSEDGMRVFCTGNIPLFLKLIDRCVSLLIENEIRDSEYCSKCGNKFGSRKPKKVTYDKENHIMCEHCALETVEEISNRAAEDASDEKKGNVGLAIICSTLLSLVGASLYFVLYYFLSPAMSESGLNEVRYIFCVVGFVVSMLAYYGYKFFSKKAGPCAYITVAVNSLLFTAIGQYIGIVFEFIAKNGFNLSALSNKHFWLVHLRNTIPADVSDLFTDYSAIFWKLLIISLMFAAVGAAIFLLSLHDKSAQKKETVEIETITIK
ncbi:MAG: hypothetical protein J6Q89_07085 [Clostridia bacterium]|nr:hypothetical protein [Clostridia bacterium]